MRASHRFLHRALASRLKGTRSQHTANLSSAYSDTALQELGLSVRKKFASQREVASLSRLAGIVFDTIPYSSKHTDGLIRRYRETAVSLGDSDLEPASVECLRRVQSEAWAATEGCPGRG